MELSLSLSLPGFRFRPPDEELITKYLSFKNNGEQFKVKVIREIDICKWEPWELPGLSIIQTDDQEWFFFSPRDRKYRSGSRSNRATEAGYWKVTGKDRTIKSHASGMNLIGMKRSLVFHLGRAPKGQRTNWIMHEYREIEPDGTDADKGAFVLYRLFKKQPIEKTENSNCDVIESTGSSPPTTEPSPDGMPSTLALFLATLVGEQPEGIESHSTSHVASDMVDHEPEGTSSEMDQELKEFLGLFYVPTTEPLECKVFSPLRSEMCTNMDSPFTNNFGKSHNELMFQDGTKEQDVLQEQLSLLLSIPGFRFRPADEELITKYLSFKNNNQKFKPEVIREIDICKWEPWDLPELSIIKKGYQEWFFFSPRDRKYRSGSRSNRATEAGYWKVTGKDRTIKSHASGMNLIGMKRSLVFHLGRAPKGQRTDWIMHEYWEIEPDGMDADKGAFVLYRLFKKQPIEKTENSNCDVIEPTGSSPTTTEPSPDGMPSTLALGLATLVGEQPEGIESHSTSHVASDMVEHEPEETSVEKDPELEEDLELFYVPTTEPLDCKVFSPLQSEICTNQGLSYMDSPFTKNFEKNHNELVFQDGTSEQDVLQMDTGLEEDLESFYVPTYWK